MRVEVFRIFAAKDKDIYHVTVMPCFDKKLEAARQEFQIESNGRIVKDVGTGFRINYN